MYRYDDQLKVFHSTLLDDTHHLSGFGTRMTGDGRKRSTLINFFEVNDVPYKSLIIPDQIHSANIELIPPEGDVIRVIDTTDGVVTVEDNLALSVVTADCVPIIFSDKKNGVVGISHQGWRGTLKRLATHMIDKMVEMGADIREINVAIGPAIGACCYEMYGDRLYEFLAEFEEVKDTMLVMRGGKTHLSLLFLNYYQLLKKGLDKNHIDFFPFCTKCDADRFFSFQRDNTQRYGEMFSYIIKV